MTEQIYLGDIECPHCERDTYCEDGEVKVNRYSRQKTEITCDEYGKRFFVITELTVSIVGS